MVSRHGLAHDDDDARPESAVDRDPDANDARPRIGVPLAMWASRASYHCTAR